MNPFGFIVQFVFRSGGAAASPSDLDPDHIKIALESGSHFHLLKSVAGLATNKDARCIRDSGHHMPYTTTHLGPFRRPFCDGAAATASTLVRQRYI